MENKSFKKFLEAKSTGVKVERQGGRISWDEEIMKDKRSFIGFLEFAYSDKKSGEFIYLDRSTTFDVLERINWLENKIRRNGGVEKPPFSVVDSTIHISPESIPRGVDGENTSYRS